MAYLRESTSQGEKVLFLFGWGKLREDLQGDLYAFRPPVQRLTGVKYSHMF